MEREINHRYILRDYLQTPRPRRRPVFPTPHPPSFFYNPNNYTNIPTPPPRPNHNLNRPNPPPRPPSTIEFSFSNPRDTNLQTIFNSLLNDISVANPNNEDNETRNLNLQDIINFTEIITLENNENDEPTMCTICRNNIEPNEPLRKLKNCNHFFHINCIDNWLTNNNTCPICRQPVRMTSTNI